MWKPEATHLMNARGGLVTVVCCLLLFSVACGASEPESADQTEAVAEQDSADGTDQAGAESGTAEDGNSANSDDAPASEPARSGTRPANLPVIANDPDQYDWLEFQTYPNSAWGFRSVLVAFAETDHIDYDMMGLEYICDANVGLWVLAAAYPSYDGAQRGISAPLNLDLGFPASAVFSGSASGSDRYLEFDVLESGSAQYSNGVEFMSTSKAHENVIVRLPFEESYITATFDLRGVFDTPIQPNLDWCGRY